VQVVHHESTGPIMIETKKSRAEIVADAIVAYINSRDVRYAEVQKAMSVARQGLVDALDLALNPTSKID